MKIRVLIACICLSLAAPAGAAQSDAQATALAQVVKILHMCKAPGPTEIILEILPFKEMEKRLAEMGNPFVRPRPEGPAGNIYPRGYVEIKEVANKKLHIRLLYYDQDVLIHEALHYCIHWMTDPPGAIHDHHSFLDTLRRQYVLSDEWVEFMRDGGDGST